MASPATQRLAHKFFVEHLQTLEPFTKEDIKKLTGWADTALDAYWSKQFKGFLEKLPGNKFRMTERFRAFVDWKKFRGLVTQVKTVPPTYAPTVYKNIIVYEFYMPLAHENTLRITLDSMFFKDPILPRLKRIGFPTLETHFPRKPAEADEQLLERVCKFVSDKFVGYSIYHVDGRFRRGDLTTRKKALEVEEQGGHYLIDETTAVVRFIFPCGPDEPEKVGFLFRELFMNSITQQVSGEDEIWVVESGMNNEVHVWKPGE